MWAYHDAAANTTITGQTSGPQANWKTVAEASLDATWLSGPGGFGYADNVTETNQCRTILCSVFNYAIRYEKYDKNFGTREK